MQLLPFDTIFSVISLSLGIALICLKSETLELITTSVLILTPNSPIKNTWLKPPDVVPTNIYLFNWTNPEDFFNVTTKPKFHQVGPYRFLQHVEKRNVVWNDNDTVTFNQMRYWHFDERNTERNLSDKVTTINVLAMCLAHYTKYWNYFGTKAVSIFIASKYELSFTHTVDEMLCSGIKDTLLDVGNVFPFIAEEIPRFDALGLLRMRNASETFDGTFNIANGADGNFDVINWNYYNKTPHFNGDCAKVRGSATELYSRPNNRDFIEIFMSDVCRTLRLDFEEEVVVDGVKGYKYSVGKGVMDNGTLVPGNECYCAGDCTPSGMINASACRYNMPVFISLPNFYQADPIYLDTVEGLHPEKSAHEAYIVLEPRTGILLKAVARLQLNLYVHPVKDVSLFENAPKIFIPIVWIEQIVTFPKSQVLYLKMFLFAPNAIVGVSIILILLGIYLLVFLVFKTKFVTFYKNLHTSKQKSEEVPLRQTS